MQTTVSSVKKAKYPCNDTYGSVFVLEVSRTPGHVGFFPLSCNISRDSDETRLTRQANTCADTFTWHSIENRAFGDRGKYLDAYFDDFCKSEGVEHDVSSAYKSPHAGSAD